MVVFRKDPCGVTCLLMTYAAVIYADYVVVRWIGGHSITTLTRSRLGGIFTLGLDRSKQGTKMQKCAFLLKSASICLMHGRIDA